MKRSKAFGLPCRSLDRNVKARVLFAAKALSHRTEKGKHYGVLTGKALVVLRALLFDFHNAASGKCFPSLEKVAAAAHCCKQTVVAAIAALEAAGLLEVVNRLVRTRVPDHSTGLWRWRVLRTSNAYLFRDAAALPSRPSPKPSKSKFQSGTRDQVIIPSLFDALGRLGEAISRERSGPPGRRLAG